MNAQLVKDLTAMRLVLCDPRRHTQGAMARDEEGNECSTKGWRAVRWCVAGIADSVALNAQQAIDAFGYFVNPAEVGAVATVDFNDTHTHAEVLAALDALIEKEMAQ